jgi:hypothetical protein
MNTHLFRLVWFGLVWFGLVCLSVCWFLFLFFGSFLVVVVLAVAAEKTTCHKLLFDEAYMIKHLNSIKTGIISRYICRLLSGKI